MLKLAEVYMDKKEDEKHLFIYTLNHISFAQINFISLTTNRLQILLVIYFFL